MKAADEALSSYGLMTAERILERFELSLSPPELQKALAAPSFYRELLELPSRNLYNGILYQQAATRLLYIKKRLMEETLSPEYLQLCQSQALDEMEEENSFSQFKEFIDERREALLALNQDFKATKLAHDTSIAQSQALLKALAAAWKLELYRVTDALRGKLAEKMEVEAADFVVTRAKARDLFHALYLEGVDSATDAFWEKAEAGFGYALTLEERQEVLAALAAFRQFLPEEGFELSEYQAKAEETQTLFDSYRATFGQFMLELVEKLSNFSGKATPASEAEEDLSALFSDYELGELNLPGDKFSS